MTPLPLALLLAAPAFFPSLHPLAVWIGMGCIAVAPGLLWKADEMGSSETTLRADEAAQWLRCMEEVRVT